jgi:hypothetical protein
VGTLVRNIRVGSAHRVGLPKRHTDTSYRYLLEATCQARVRTRRRHRYRFHDTYEGCGSKSDEQIDLCVLITDSDTYISVMSAGIGGRDSEGII